MRFPIEIYRTQYFTEYGEKVRKQFSSMFSFFIILYRGKEPRFVQQWTSPSPLVPLSRVRFWHSTRLLNRSLTLFQMPIHSARPLPETKTVTTQFQGSLWYLNLLHAFFLGCLDCFRDILMTSIILEVLGWKLLFLYIKPSEVVCKNDQPDNLD